MKHLVKIIPILINLLICCYDSIFAQDICIRLSVLDNPNTNDDNLSPYLQIEYLNNSNKSYYFPALVSSASERPRFKSDVLICSSNENNKSGSYVEDSNMSRDILYDKKEFKGLHYYLPISFLQMTDASWELIPADIYINSEEHEEDFINYLLFSYNNKDCSIEPTFFTRHQLKCSRFIRKSPSFVFLEGGEKVIQRVSLHGISGTGVILTFCLYSCNSPRKMHTGYGENNVINLPRKVYKYHLYEGHIQSNIITIQF